MLTYYAGLNLLISVYLRSQRPGGLVGDSGRDGPLPFPNKRTLPVDADFGLVPARHLPQAGLAWSHESFDCLQGSHAGILGPLGGAIVTSS